LTGKPLVTIGEAPAAQAGSAVGETTGSGAQLGAKLADGLVLLPRRLADGGQALEVGTKSEGAVLAEAKLRAGDLIVGVDNQPMDSAGVQLLRQELAQADAVEISFLRAGQLRKRLIVLRA
jgi:C-terminal processing protease CtpA/Prc